ncbi:LysR family transcriptional regulator [Paraglaciecola aquimarina]|uniref:LysR family transcriptional regulator n=1 Tax=Paraglaciecola algarum TaxID=3050085 RepID=A0ABS9D7W1_9ALTE|nr:LysR family transcriptional regulator [Paraglaciecola sp. G1-23]MCF2948966.1 LysR family transcriptional regulator [Paraglaciecola sp. G1-23]
MVYERSFDASLFDGIAIFVILVDEGSFTKAAIATGHSTSYISKQLNKLEEKVGVRLLNRTTRNLGLTAEGQAFYFRCQKIVDDTRQATGALFGSQDEPKGTLKISCPVSLGLSKLRPLISEFMVVYPKVNIELELNDRKVDIVSEGFDLAIRASRKLDDSSLISRCVLKSHSLVIASPDYLDRFGTPQHPADLIHHKTISYSNLKHPNLWEFIDLDGSNISVKVDSHILTNSAEMEIAMCIAGKGITQMPTFNLSDEIQQGKLVELFKSFKKQQIEVYLVYPSRKHMPSKVRCFIDYVIANLK